jgi:hypothetical protein
LPTACALSYIFSVSSLCLYCRPNFPSNEEATTILTWRVKARKQSAGLAAITFFFALDTLRFSSYLLDEGGGQTAVYGYGWGCVLWFTSIGILVAATGTLAIENRLNSISANGQQAEESSAEWLRPVGLVLSLTVFSIALILSYRDHIHANTAERTRLEGLAFKRGAVCSVEDPTVLKPVVTQGALEVVLPKDELAAYPFNGPRRLLDWGIPKVRFGDRDFYYEVGPVSNTLVTVPATEPPASRLFVSRSFENGLEKITATLVAVSGERVVFEQAWVTEAQGGSRFCPSFSSSPSGDQQPRKLLLDALHIATRPPEKAHTKTNADNRATATITSSKVSEYRPALEPNGSASDPRPPGSLNWRGNQNCPSDVGWGGAVTKNDSARLDSGWPFFIGSKAYYLNNRNEYSALCQGEFAFLYNSTNSDDKSYLQIEKRSLRNFEILWRGVVEFKPRLTPKLNHVRLNSIEETPDGISLSITNEDQWLDLLVNAPLKTSIPQ